MARPDAPHTEHQNGTSGASAGGRRPAIPASIWTLGLVSLFTDLGSEMVHSVLPLLLVGGLGATALVVGLIEGAAEALVLVTKVFSGYLSDAIGRRKPLVLLGYGLAAAAKPLFPLADSVAAVATGRLLDRFGKGLRGAPRDALVGDLAPASIRGACFGLRQSLDTVGAVLGPLLAVALLWGFADDIQLVLWVAVLPGILAVSLLLSVREPATRERKPARLPLDRDGLSRLGAAFWALVLVAGLLALARFSEAFLLLRAVDLGLDTTWAPLVMVVMSVVYTLVAYPAGRWSDRVPRRRVLVVGLAMLVLADVVLAFAQGVGLLFLGVALWGAHLGLTQGVLATLVTDTAPPSFRGTAFGVLNLVGGVALILGSVTAGWLWDSVAPSAAFLAGALLATAATALALRLAPRG